MFDFSTDILLILLGLVWYIFAFIQYQELLKWHGFNGLMLFMSPRLMWLIIGPILMIIWILKVIF